jgi:hypothetical protein
MFRLTVIHNINNSKKNHEPIINIESKMKNE